MRRFLLLVPLFALLLVTAPPVRAQSSDDVVLRLVSQTPWNDPDHSELSVRVRAVNDSEQTLDDLSLGVAIETPTGSRSEYDQSLSGDTGEVVLATAPPLTGTLAAGESRTLRVPPIDLSVIAQRAESGIYPMKVELRSHDQPVATLRSPVIFLSKDPPDQPLDLSWSFVLSAPILYEPNGHFRTPWLQRQVAHGGPLRAEAEALAKLASKDSGGPFDVAIAPQLVDQLEAMRDGYTLDVGGQTQHVEAGDGSARAAGDMLDALTSMGGSSSVELSALPFAGPSLPALVQGGLSDDIAPQLSKGRADVADALGQDPVPSVLHPPGSRIDQNTLFELHRNGVRILLVDRDTVEPRTSNPRGFAQPAVATLSVGPDQDIDAIDPDDGVQSLLESSLPDQDPHLAVQAVLGELAAIWLEQPSVPRGLAMTLSQRTGVPGYFYAPFVKALDQAPWLNPITASNMTLTHPPAGAPAAIASRRGPTFSPEYVADLQGARQEIETYRSIQTEQSTLPANLSQLLLVAESGQFASEEAFGQEFLDDVSRRLTGQFELVRADTSEPVTLTSRTGKVPVPILNESGHPVKVRVELSSNRLTFVNGASRTVQIAGDGVTLVFGVQARTTGRFPVTVSVLTPDGHVTLSKRRLVVRSTAYNRIALVLTIGAALFLLALWARRLLPWTKR